MPKPRPFALSPPGCVEVGNLCGLLVVCLGLFQKAGEPIPWLATWAVVSVLYGAFTAIACAI